MTLQELKAQIQAKPDKTEPPTYAEFLALIEIAGTLKTTLTRLSNRLKELNKQIDDLLEDA